MDGDKITLDRDTFKALAVDSRVQILKLLDERQHTLSDLAEELHMAPSTIKEHLDILVAAGLIRQEDKGTKLKYYKLTFKGRQVINPFEKRVLIVLTASAIGMMVFAYTLYSRIKGLVVPDLAPDYAPQALKSAVESETAGAREEFLKAASSSYGLTNVAADNANNSVPMMPPTTDVAQGKIQMTSESMNELANAVVTTVNDVSTTLASAIRLIPQSEPAYLMEKAASTVYLEVILFALFALITGLCMGYLIKKKKII